MTTDPTQRAVLADRYGTSGGRRWLVISLAAVVIAAFLGWLAWATWFHATPAVTSEIGPHEIVSAHEVEATVDVDLDADAQKPQCRLRVLAEDHSVVGELAFTPTDGRNTVTVRTERRATSVELVGCTAGGQSRPQ